MLLPVSIKFSAVIAKDAVAFGKLQAPMIRSSLTLSMRTEVAVNLLTTFRMFRTGINWSLIHIFRKVSGYIAICHDAYAVCILGSWDNYQTTKDFGPGGCASNKKIMFV